jgi:Transposase DDE domain
MAKHLVSLAELERVLPAHQVQKLAVQFRVDAHNQVRLPGRVVFTCLLDCILNYGAVSQRLLEERYRQQVGKSVDHSSFGDRLSKIKPEYFKAIYEQTHARLAPQISAAQDRGFRVRRADATIVTLSSKILHWGLSSGTRKGAGTKRQVKAVFSLEDDLPGLLRICDKQSETSDSVSLGDTMIANTRAGDLWIFDKGCHSRIRLLKLHQKKAFWLTPHSTQALRECETVWEARDSSPPAGEPGREDPTFLVQRVERVCFGNTHDTAAQMKEWQSMPILVLHGVRWDVRSRSWKAMSLMTNLPLGKDGQGAGLFTWAEVAELYRSRWEIEVFFKFLKQHLGYAHLTSRSENGIRVMIYMCMIAALLMIWYRNYTGIDRGWRSVRS